MEDAKKMRSEASTSRSGGGNCSAGESIVEDTGRRKGMCGYCKSAARTSISHGLWAHSLTVDAYQVLLDRGWRRSGCYLYKPDMEKTCCPSYTIRLKAEDFVPSKEQIRVYRKMERFLKGKLDVKEPCVSKDAKSEGLCCTEHYCYDKTHVTAESSVCRSKTRDEDEQLAHLLSDQIDSGIQLFLKSLDSSLEAQLPKSSVKKVVAAKKRFQSQESEELTYSCSAAFQIAATLRRLKKGVEHGDTAEFDVDKKNLNKYSPEKIADFLAGHSKQLAESYGLSVRACNGHINYYSTPSLMEVDVGRRTRRSETTPPVESVKGKHLKKICQGHPKQQHNLEIRLRISCFDFEEYSLYRKYQLIVHNDTPDHVTESSYKRFLVDTPLIHIPPNGNSAVPPCGFGSFHQQYLVDGKLFAVGVIDILPKSLSSKYLFWDPDFAFLSLGKYSALEEIRWVCENKVHCPSLQYYYLGYYIHSCSKMRYKAAYQPSELLCPLRYQWIPYVIGKRLLERRKYMVLSDYSKSPDMELLPQEEQCNSFVEELASDLLVYDDDSEFSDDAEETSTVTRLESEDANLKYVLIGLRGLRLRYKDIQHAFDPIQRKYMEKQLQAYIKAVGPQLSQEMVYSLG